MSSRRQPHRLPPPITFGGEALDAGIVLRELPGDSALYLWKSVRDLRLWADVPPEERADAFAPDALARRRDRLRAADVDAELRPLLEDAAGLLDGVAGDPAAAVRPFEPLQQWAEERGHAGTALEIAQALALASPDDAARARQVALLARRQADYPRAETWFRQAMWIARRVGDWKTYVRSSLGVGVVHLQRGNFPAAERAYLRALRRARRHAYRDLVARSHHELAVLAIHSDRRAAVVRHARAALQAYGPGHEQLPALAHDVAAYWVHRGYFEEALRVFQAMAPHWQDPAARLSHNAAVVRAAAAVGDRTAYEEAWSAATEILAQPHAVQDDVRAMLAMARGAASLADWDRAEETAARAYDLARQHGEGKQILDAEGVLDSIRAARQTDATAADAPLEAPKAAQRLAGELVSAVRQTAHAG